MKYIKCNACGDMVALRSWEKKCRCGESGGKYLPDNKTVSVFGNCVVLAVPNDAFFEVTENVERRSNG